MAVRIANDFLGSLSDLQANEQVRVVQFVLKFSENPAHPSLSLERLKRAEGNLWSGRVSQDLRAILHKEGDSWALLHAGHHDAAYSWVERKRVDRHSVTGGLQIVDLEVVEQFTATAEMTATRGTGLFTQYEDDYLVSLGLPETWLPAVRAIQFEDQLLTACEDLPEEVAERLLTLATGTFVTPPDPGTDDPASAAAPANTRRFYVAQDEDELRAALEAPLERWISFLHPSQRKLVEGTFNGPVKVTGSAGTGKTVVALHRAKKLAKDGHQVLVTTYVSTLKENLERSLRLLSPGSETRSRIQVSTVHSEALKVVKKAEPGAHPVSSKKVQELLDTLCMPLGSKFDADFVRAEWENVILRRGIQRWAEYREVPRTGRGKPLSIPDRKALWNVFEECRSRLRQESGYTWTDLCARAASLLDQGEVASPFEAVIVDEVQDLAAAEIRFLWALAQGRPELFMVVGDAGQRIYPGGFSFRALGIEVRGRSHILRVNYRTTEQIRRAADALLGGESDDLDGGTESRADTRSLLSGPAPIIRGFEGDEAETRALVVAILEWIETGLVPEDIAVFVRTNQLVGRYVDALGEAGLPCQALRKTSSLTEPGVRVGTMHRAKGLEFKAVAVPSCSAQHLPNPTSLQRAIDPQDRDAAVEQERRLVYVAMTRARDELLVTWNGEPSPFLAPLTDAPATPA